MDFELNESQTMIRDMVRDFARNELAPKAKDRDLTGAFPVEEIKAMAGLGLLGMSIPEEYGGSNVGPVAYSLSVTEIAKADASVAVIMSVTNMVNEILLKFGNEEQKKRWIPFIVEKGNDTGAFALTEPGSGSDAGSMKTTASRDGDYWILDGVKQFISHADHSGVLITWARSELDSKGPKGVSTFLVPQNAPGLILGKKEDKMGQRGSSTLEVVFDGCRIPRENLMYEEGRGFAVAMAALNGGRIGIASLALGVGLAALEAARDYALERKQFGHPIGDFQAIQWKLADMATELDAARLLVLRAAWLKENGYPYTKEASMAKVFASETANRVCAEAIQIHGGYGYCRDYPVERYARDARVTTIYEGSSEVQRIVIAREILGRA